MSKGKFIASIYINKKSFEYRGEIGWKRMVKLIRNILEGKWIKHNLRRDDCNWSNKFIIQKVEDAHIIMGKN